MIYVVYGTKRGQRDCVNRAASFVLSMAGGGTTPEQFIERAEQLARAHGRKNQTADYVLAFSPDEFDVTKQKDLDRVRDVAVKLTERMHSADYLVVVHAHAHIIVVNHDTLTGRSLQRYTSWKHGLHQLNDELMAEEGLAVLPDPAQPNPDWEQRREQFAHGGFEQVLGDKVFDALTDSRSVGRARFEQVLAVTAGRTRCVVPTTASSGARRLRDSLPSSPPRVFSRFLTITHRGGLLIGALDRLKQADEQQQITETLEALISTVRAVEQHLVTLTKTVANLAGFVKVMDDVQTTRLDRLTLQQCEPSSTQPDDETKKRLSEIEKTLASASETLSASKSVKLPSGESVRQSDLDSFSMMHRIEKRLETTGRASDELADAVNKRGRIVIDPDKLAVHAVKVLDARLVKAVDARVSGLENRVAVLGAAQIAKASERTEQVIAKAEGVVRSACAIERRVEALSGRLAWTAAGRLGLALLPLAAVLLVLGGLTMGVFHRLGIGPLLGWAWESFELAELWWHKLLIALGALGGITVFGWLVWLGARRLADVLRGW